MCIVNKERFMQRNILERYSSIRFTKITHGINRALGFRNHAYLLRKWEQEYRHLSSLRVCSRGLRDLNSTSQGYRPIYRLYLLRPEFVQPVHINFI